MGKMPPTEVLSGLGLPSLRTEGGEQRQQETAAALNPFAAILPLLTTIPQSWEAKDKADTRPIRYLVAKGLPTIPTKLADKVWKLDYVDMEEFLPTPRSLRLAEQEKPSPSLQESLVGALNQFQASQLQQKSQRRVLDVVTWSRCFTLYIPVMAKRHADMIPSMVAHFHTVLKLHQKAPQSTAWREYDIQFRMEQATTEDRVWKEGDPWQYVSCLPGPSSALDPFDLADQATAQQQESRQSPLSLMAPSQRKEQSQPGGPGKGKRPLDSTAGKAPASGGLPGKRPKKGGACKWFNRTPAGCPYGEECRFIHRCSNCGVEDDHGAQVCRLPPRPPSAHMS